MGDVETAEAGRELGEQLRALLRAVEKEEGAHARLIDRVLPRHRRSAINLSHYLGLRKQDIHRLQLELAALGLSSLGRSEGHVRDTLMRLCAWIEGRHAEAMAPAAEGRLGWALSEATLHANARALFGAKPKDRHVYIMVTAPEAAQATVAWADALLDAGANLLRINGAHEGPDGWAAIVRVFRARAERKGVPVRVFVDLPGPKLRVDIRQMESGVLHFPRRKDRLGRTLAPTSLQLVGKHDSGAQVPIPEGWLARLRKGDVLLLTDAARRTRSLVVRSVGAGGARAECDRSLYVTSGLSLTWMRHGHKLAQGRIGPLPRQPRDMRLSPGDAFLLNGTGLSPDPEVRALAFPVPAMLATVKTGDRVLIDDGRIAAVVESRTDDGLLCRVGQAVKAPARLRSGKGIAFPDSALSLGRLGEQDEAALAFALAEADGVGVSFVATAADVALVGERLRATGKPGFGMILKLETRGAMRNLPAILFEALRYEPVGLMIARGDLAVEMSFERLAEMQEELLWFGEACHLPVIWATQVLDSVAHTGLPTRAEVTDAAMSMRAECVMLNKGPHVAVAVRMLADIIRKMEAHQYKKRALNRRLALARED